MECHLRVLINAHVFIFWNIVRKWVVGRRSFPVGFRPIFRAKLWLVSGSLRTAIDWFFNYIPVNISGWGDIFPFPSRKCIHLYPRCSMYDITYIYHKNPPYIYTSVPWMLWDIYIHVENWVGNDSNIFFSQWYILVVSRISFLDFPKVGYGWKSVKRFQIQTCIMRI